VKCSCGHPNYIKELNGRFGTNKHEKSQQQLAKPPGLPAKWQLKQCMLACV